MRNLFAMDFANRSPAPAPPRSRRLQSGRRQVLHHAATVLLVLAGRAGALTAGQAEEPAKRQAGPYIDNRHLTTLEFGAHSHWLQPWRAYQETLPTSRFLNAQGIVLDIHDGADPDMVLRMLADHGVRHARIEIGWGFINFFDETKLNHEARLKGLLKSCEAHHVRPLILLNANSGVPGPINVSERALSREARKGDRSVELADVSDLKAGYSGFANLTDYRASEVLITAIKGNSVTLSKPLPKDLGKAGAKVVVTTLKYRPFSAPGTEDYRNTINGWKQYVSTVARFVATALGTPKASDLGFDMEIWNELTFGSAFLSINNYYEPKLLDYNEYRIWDDLVRETADLAVREPDVFRGVTLVDGFHNTIPWPAASREPLRIGALSSHPYPPRKTYPKDEQPGPAVNALFNQVKEAFTPTYTSLFPEYHATALQTETLVRDMGPITTPIQGTPHGRESRVIGAKTAPCPLWLTEIGIHPREHGIADATAALRVKAKATIRDACFFPAKGVERIYFFSALGGDTGYGLVQDNFVEYARTHTDFPRDPSPYVSPALQALGRIVAKMRIGASPKTFEPRSLVASVSDTHDHYQFRGDGSSSHPHLHNRDVFVFLPFQANDRRFVVPYYIMTRDITKELPPEEYALTIRGINGRRAVVSSYDPMADVVVPTEVKSGTPHELVLNVRAADYPYLLLIQENEGGPPTRPGP